MSGKRSRNRGAETERMVVRYLRYVGWPSARRYLAGDGTQPGDIDWAPPVLIEVKGAARSAWPTWWRQALSEAHADHELVVVTRRVDGEPEPALWPAEVVSRVRLAGPLSRHLHPTRYSLLHPARIVDGGEIACRMSLAHLVDLVGRWYGTEDPEA